MQFVNQTAFETLEPRTLLSAIKIMPLGDSITEAFAPRESYRYWLWNSLVNAGYKDLDFVGSNHGVSGGEPADPNFDEDHEGHSGWTADGILAEIGGWASTYQPDIVMMHLGTNDVRGGESVDSTINDLGQIIDTLREVNPRVTILLSQIIPSDRAIDETNQLNESIPALAAGKQNSDSRIIVINQASDFDVNSDTYDGLHPNQPGEQKMAAKYFDGLKQVLPDPNATSAPPPPRSNTTYISKLSWTAMSNFVGPVERDLSNGGEAEGDGAQINIRGQNYNHGLGVSANSRIDYRLNGRQKYFAADIGIDGETSGNGSVVFKIYADGKRIFCSNIITGSDVAEAIKLNIHKVRHLTLMVTDAGDGPANDHADWANARLVV